MACLALLAGAFALAGSGATEEPVVWFQAHRGGLLEVPENTMAAFRHAWECPGAIPELDVRTTKDGVMVCLHDDTPGRTTNAPETYKDVNVAEITFDQFQQWDAGVTFGPAYVGEKVPRLTEVFDEMKGHPERQLYLDVKAVDLEKLMAAVNEYGLGRQVILVGSSQEQCIEFRKRFPETRTMTWLSGTPSEIKQRFEELSRSGFEGISQLQFHLKTRTKGDHIVYVLDDDFLRHALKATSDAGTALQLRPFDFDEASLRGLLDLGVRWYAADEPRRFADTLAAAVKR